MYSNFNNIFNEMAKNFTEMNNNFTKNYNANGTNHFNPSNMTKYMANYGSFLKAFHNTASCMQTLNHIMMENVKNNADLCSEMIQQCAECKDENPMNHYNTHLYKFVQEAAKNNMECMREMADVFSKTASENVKHANEQSKENIKKAQDNMDSLKKKAA